MNTKTTKKLTLAEQVRAAKLWTELAATLKEPISDEDKKKLKFVGRYMEQKYANSQESESGPGIVAPDGTVVKSLREIGKDGNEAFVEITPQGRAYWILGNGFFNTNGMESFDFFFAEPEVADKHWVLYQHQEDGSVVETHRDEDNVRTVHHKAKKQERKTPTFAPKGNDGR